MNEGIMVVKPHSCKLLSNFKTNRLYRKKVFLLYLLTYTGGVIESRISLKPIGASATCLDVHSDEVSCLFLWSVR